MDDFDTAISFDEFSKIRILPSQHYEESEHLKDECREFTQKIGDFNTIVQSFLDVLVEKSEQIEQEKLRAIGLRNKVESEVGRRSAQVTQYHLLIKERQAEMERLAVQADSLQSVLAEQQRLIESLSSK
ncbi:Intraflagellar transport protein 20 [Irineochytrium annulatum]|nr:Intraflagellar transport protein 20 [Irineochytrium annulatum]